MLWEKIEEINKPVEKSASRSVDWTLHRTYKGAEKGSAEKGSGVFSGRDSGTMVPERAIVKKDPRPLFPIVVPPPGMARNILAPLCDI